MSSSIRDLLMRTLSGVDAVHPQSEISPARSPVFMALARMAGRARRGRCREGRVGGQGVEPRSRSCSAPPHQCS